MTTDTSNKDQINDIKTDDSKLVEIKQDLPKIDEIKPIQKDDDNKQICTKCNKLLMLDDFYSTTNSNGKSYIRHTCKSCSNTYVYKKTGLAKYPIDIQDLTIKLFTLGVPLTKISKQTGIPLGSLNNWKRAKTLKKND
jgi:hypothetical protein